METQLPKSSPLQRSAQQSSLPPPWPTLPDSDPPATDYTMLTHTEVAALDNGNGIADLASLVHAVLSRIKPKHSRRRQYSLDQIQELQASLARKAAAEPRQTPEDSTANALQMLGSVYHRSNSADRNETHQCVQARICGCLTRRHREGFGCATCPGRTSERESKHH